MALLELLAHRTQMDKLSDVTSHAFPLVSGLGQLGNGFVDTEVPDVCVVRLCDA